MSSESQLSPAGLDFTPTIHHDTYPFVAPEQFALRGRAVLVTGASKGIGRATALAYARAGASHIAIAARSSLGTLQTALADAAQHAGHPPPTVLPLQMDVTDLGSVEAGAAELQRAFGRLDILISNAGFLEPFRPILEGDPAAWKRGWEVNVFGVYHVARAFVPLLRETPGGLRQILNLTSVGAHFVMAGGSGYQPAKLAVLRFSEFINTEYPELLSYGVHPGGVATELSAGMGADKAHLLIDTAALAADTLVWLTAERREFLRSRYVSVTWDMRELVQKRQRIVDEDLLKIRMAV